MEEMEVLQKLIRIVPTPEILNHFSDAVKRCRRCLLHKTRSQVVVGDGTPMTDLMLIGEAPGKEEDEQGIPFVGRAGKLLDKILDYTKIDRQKIYITNSVLCRPPDNRNPLFNEEIMACSNRLMCHIYMVQPKIVVAMGRIALQALLGEEIKGPLGEYIEKNDLKLKIGSYEADIIVTYHPSYLLRQPSKKTDAAKHWDKIKERLKCLSKTS